VQGLGYVLEPSVSSLRVGFGPTQDHQVVRVTDDRAEVPPSSRERRGHGRRRSRAAAIRLHPRNNKPCPGGSPLGVGIEWRMTRRSWPTSTSLTSRRSTRWRSATAELSAARGPVDGRQHQIVGLAVAGRVEQQAAILDSGVVGRGVDGPLLGVGVAERHPRFDACSAVRKREGAYFGGRRSVDGDRKEQGGASSITMTPASVQRPGRLTLVAGLPLQADVSTTEHEAGHAPTEAG
jgi:hypothetical protein